VKKIAAILALLCFLPAQVFSWGPKGHAVIADIAESRLTPTTRANLDLLLGNNSLASISTWPDAIRSDRDETYGWHFVDIPAKAAGFDEARDCFRPQDSDKHPSAATDHHNCVVDRIEMFGHVLADANASERDRLLALLFLVHFVADVHQPLHAIEEARGGNDIKVVVFGSDQCGNNPCNLHGVWDSGLVEHTGYTEEQYVTHLNELIARNHLEQKAGGSPADWANESHHAAIQALVKNGAAIDDAYYRANIQLVDERLALAGIRLAVLLNDRLGKIPTDQFKQELLRHQH
jgi:S1/P1 Nuclease